MYILITSITRCFPRVSTSYFSVNSCKRSGFLLTLLTMTLYVARRHSMLLGHLSNWFELAKHLVDNVDLFLKLDLVFSSPALSSIDWCWILILRRMNLVWIISFA